MTVRSLRECVILKLFRTPGMWEYVRLLEHMIRMWDPNQQHFVVGIHTLMIDVENIYFLIRLSHRGRQVVLTGLRGGEKYVDDLINDHCSVRTQLVGGKIPIKHIVDRPLRTMGFTIKMVLGTISAHYYTTILSPTCDKNLNLHIFP